MNIQYSYVQYTYMSTVKQNWILQRRKRQEDDDDTMTAAENRTKRDNKPANKLTYRIIQQKTHALLTNSTREDKEQKKPPKANGERWEPVDVTPASPQNKRQAKTNNNQPTHVASGHGNKQRMWLTRVHAMQQPMGLLHRGEGGRCVGRVISAFTFHFVFFLCVMQICTIFYVLRGSVRTSVRICARFPQFFRALLCSRRKSSVFSLFRAVWLWKGQNRAVLCSEIWKPGKYLFRAECSV